MKYLFYLSLSLVLLACNKDNRLNRKIDGSWKLTSFNNANTSSEESEIYKFNRDKKGIGTGTYTYTSDGNSISYPYDYSISDEKLTMSYTLFGTTETESYTIDELDKDKLIVTDSDNDTYVLTKQ